MERIVSLEKFKQQHDAYYQRIIDSIPQKGIVSVIEGFLEKIINVGDLCIRVPIERLEKIVNDNCLKTQVELKEGRTFGGATTRKEVAKTLFGCDLEKMSDSDFPKSGYLGPQEKRLDFVVNNSLNYQYGEVILTLKKENLKPRTTMTVGDSVNFNIAQWFSPTLIEKPRMVCIAGVNRDDKMPIAPQNFRWYLFFAYAISGKVITPENFYRLAEIFDYQNGFEFFELQFHGDILFDRDIQQVDILKSTLDEIQNGTELCTRIENMGIKVNIQKFF